MSSDGGARHTLLPVNPRRCRRSVPATRKKHEYIREFRVEGGINGCQGSQIHQ